MHYQCGLIEERSGEPGRETSEQKSRVSYHPRWWPSKINNRAQWQSSHNGNCPIWMSCNATWNWMPGYYYMHFHYAISIHNCGTDFKHFDWNRLIGQLGTVFNKSERERESRVHFKGALCGSCFDKLFNWLVYPFLSWASVIVKWICIPTNIKLGFTGVLCLRSV